MENKQLRRRLIWIVGLLCALLLCFGAVLFDLQVTHGAEYAAQSKRNIAHTETVEAARGALTDRYGRVLTSNRVIYQIKLDTSLMGAQRNQTLLALMALCRARGVQWPDSLPVTAAPPFAFTTPVPGEETSASRLVRLAGLSNWALDSADDLMAAMRKTFGISDDLTDTDARALAGVLYEAALRTREVVWSVYIFASDVDIELISDIKEAGLTGVRIEPATARRYQTSSAAHLLGRVALMNDSEWEYYRELGYAMNDSVGKDGAERAFESWLRGERGKRAIERDTSGKIVSQYWLTEPQPGANVALTLDLALQQRLEQSLEERIPALRASQEKAEARGGAAVVLDVNSAAVLAMASYPTYDLSKFSQEYNELLADPLRPMVNRALQGLYSPGSTYKMVTAVGALEEEIITPATRILDTGRYTYYKDYQPMCWIYRSAGGTHGWETVSQAITDSCNVFFFDVGRRLGISKLEEYARKFGLGEQTGIELPELAGVVAGPAYTESLGQLWNEGSTLPAAIGQENNQFTPLQLANYVATLVNGGTRYAVHMLKSVSSHDFSEILFQYEPTVVDQLDLSPATLAAVKSGMLGAARSNTVAPYFAGLNVTVGAKTGSAQVSVESESNAVFVCFAPYDDPQIAIAIVVEHGGSGYQLAAIAADILSFYFGTPSALEAPPGENELIR